MARQIDEFYEAIIRVREGPLAMSARGQSAKFGRDQGTAALLSTADMSTDSWRCRDVPELLRSHGGLPQPLILSG
jgi:hypothetical protein